MTLMRSKLTGLARVWRRDDQTGATDGCQRVTGVEHMAGSQRVVPTDKR